MAQVNNQITPAIWSRTACLYETDDKRIDIWLIDLENPKFHQLELLSDDELVRSKKLIHQSDKDRFVRSRCALRIILGHCLDVQANTLVFSYGEKGKPALAMPSLPSTLTLEFNLSHSENKALIAVSRKRKLGIDISDIKRSTSNIAISKRSFTEAEHHSLIDSPIKE